jgi:hypothetical protein
VKRWCFIFLLSQLFLIALVQVLPQIDLPDTAFRDRSDPIAIHSISSACPLVLIAVSPVRQIFSHQFQGSYRDPLSKPYSPAFLWVEAACPLRC